MHSRTTRCYLSLVVASILSLLLVISHFPESRPLPDVQSSFESPTWQRKERLAFATFLGPPTSKGKASNSTEAAPVLEDPYFVSVRLLNYQIKHAEQTKTRLDSVPFLVLVLPGVAGAQIELLEDEGARIIHIEPLELPDAFDKNFIENSRFRDVLSKLRLWQLTDFDKIVYLDADSFLLQNLDDLFTDPVSSGMMTTRPSNGTSYSVEPPRQYLMAASADTYGDQTEWEQAGHVNYLCACFMLYAPSQSMFDYYMSVLTGPDAPRDAAYPEQDLLIHVHRQDGPMPWRRIPIAWSANDGEMADELALLGGVKSLHVKGWKGSEGGNVANEKWQRIWSELVKDMTHYYMILKKEYKEEE